MASKPRPTAATKLPPQPWMEAAATRRVIAALAAQGAEVRFVGGCVRDAVLGRKVKDVDIATHDPPETVMALLDAAGIEAVPTGFAHGTVTAVIGPDHFEITTLREDVETDGRHAKVAFTDDWDADAARRDLTINALSASPDGTIFDPWGGLEDLKAGRIRFVGDPRTRIQEDVLRLLRFFRFYVHYGRPPMDPDARAGCRELAHLLPTLSGERVAAETIKLLAAADPAPTLELMMADGIVAQFLPEAAEGTNGVATLRALVTIEGLGSGADPWRRLASLIDPQLGESGARGIAERWHLSNQERVRLAFLAGPPASLDAETGERERRCLLYRLGGARFRDLALLAWARSIAAHGPSSRREVEAWQAHLAAAEAWQPVSLPVKGRDALALGVPHGPEIGQLIAQVEAWWMGEDFRPDRAACLKKLEELARGTT
jgi:poly(A) polymerase